MTRGRALWSLGVVVFCLALTILAVSRDDSVSAAIYGFCAGGIFTSAMDEWLGEKS